MTNASGGLWVLASPVGVVDELLQLIIPSRAFDPVDIGFNIFAATMGSRLAAS